MWTFNKLKRLLEQHLRKSRYFRYCDLKEIKYAKVKGQRKLNTHIISENVLMLFAKITNILLCLSKPHLHFFAITFEIVHKFPSNLAGSCSNYCWILGVKTTYFTWRLCTHYLVLLWETEWWQNIAISRSFQQKLTPDLRQKQWNKLWG